MPSLRLLRSRLSIATTIAIALAVLVVLPSLVRPQAASAQSPCGSSYYSCGSNSTYGNGFTGYGNQYTGYGNQYSGYNNQYSGYNNQYSGSGCQQVLFSASGCVGGSTSYGASSYGGTSTRSCAGITLSAGQSCSNGQVSCGASTTSCAAGNSIGINNCPTNLTTPQCTSTALSPAVAPTRSSSLLASAGSTSCPGGGYALAGQSCNSSAVTASANPYSGTASAAPQTGFQVSLASGWNLIAGPAGTTLPDAGLLTFQAGDTTYETISAGTPFKAGVGYWAFVPIATQIALGPAAGASTTIALPAGQPVMIGNPGNTPATVTGADTIFIYSPGTSNYTTGTQLQPGQGAWAMSTNGGQATIANAPQGQAGLTGVPGS